MRCYLIICADRMEIVYKIALDAGKCYLYADKAYILIPNETDLTLAEY